MLFERAIYPDFPTNSFKHIDTLSKIRYNCITKKSRNIPFLERGIYANQKKKLFKQAYKQKRERTHQNRNGY